MKSDWIKKICNNNAVANVDTYNFPIQWANINVAMK